MRSVTVHQREPHGACGCATDEPQPEPAVPPRVLVVEDQADVRRMMATALGIEGYRVDEAANAHEGLERLRPGATRSS